MEVWTALIGGIIIGWLIEWLIDWQYWRRGLDGLYAAEAGLRDALEKSETERAAALDVAAAYAAQLDDLRSRLETLTRTESGARRSLETALRETARLKEQLAAAQGAQPGATGGSPPQRDPLAKIDGIGPVYEQLLFDAGIYTFAQLAAMSIDELHAAIRPAAWQKLDFDGWIRAAQDLAAQQANAGGRMP